MSDNSGTSRSADGEGGVVAGRARIEELGGVEAGEIALAAGDRGAGRLIAQQGARCRTAAAPAPGSCASPAKCCDITALSRVSAGKILRRVPEWLGRNLADMAAGPSASMSASVATAAAQSTWANDSRGGFISCAATVPLMRASSRPGNNAALTRRSHRQGVDRRPAKIADKARPARALSTGKSQKSVCSRGGGPGAIAAGPGMGQPGRRPGRRNNRERSPSTQW